MFESDNNALYFCRSDWMCKFIFWYGIGGKTASVAFIIVVTLQRYIQGYCGATRLHIHCLGFLKFFMSGLNKSDHNTSFSIKL